MLDTLEMSLTVLEQLAPVEIKIRQRRKSLADEIGLEAAALECDFFKFRGRGFIQITFRSTYLAHVAPAMRAAGLAQPGQSNSDMLDAMSEAALGNLILTDPNIFFPMTSSYYFRCNNLLDEMKKDGVVLA